MDGMLGFWARTAITGFALWAATEIVPGMHVSGLLSVLAAALVFGLINALVRPVAFWLSLPLTLLTLGLFLFVLNAAMLGLTALLVPGFRIGGFWSAVFGAVVVTIVSWIATRVFEGQEPVRR